MIEIPTSYKILIIEILTSYKILIIEILSSYKNTNYWNTNFLQKY